MHFDPRTQRALREVGLDADDLRAASDAVVESVATDAETLEAFFDEREVVYSDLDLAHSSADYPEHTVEGLDLTTHGAELRGWLRFETWGAYVAAGRPLEDGTVELQLGPPTHERVRFGADREALR